MSTNESMIAYRHIFTHTIVYLKGSCR